MLLSPDKNILLGSTLTELTELAQNRGSPRFRGQQLYRWIYTRRETELSSMTDLSQAFRAQLSIDHTVLPLTVVGDSTGSDGSVKLLFQFSDGARVEGVIIPEKERLTACLSSQAGCNLDCYYCATAGLGFKRNLTAGEIVGQLILLERRFERTMTNVVMMGMGEPLLNRDNVFKASHLITDPDGMALSRHRFTISTTGWLPGIIAMLDSGLRVKLAVSLNATTEEQRALIMPRASRYPIAAIVDAADQYAQFADIRVQFGYLLLAGINDTDDDARRLVRLVRGVPCKINVMEYNEIGGEFKRTTEEQTDRFVAIIREANIFVMVRTSRGGDINAACGQLAARPL